MPTALVKIGNTFFRERVGVAHQQAVVVDLAVVMNDDRIAGPHRIYDCREIGWDRAVHRKWQRDEGNRMLGKSNSERGLLAHVFHGVEEGFLVTQGDRRTAPYREELAEHV
jgi:hypothetical protein